MGRIGGERPPHGDLGVLDRALAIAREPVVDPGVGPARVQLDRGGEGLLGARRLAERRQGLAIGVMRRRKLRRAPAGFARAGARPDCRRARDARPRREGTGRDRRRAPAPFEAWERLGVPSGGLERDAELEFGQRIAGVELDGSAKSSIAAAMSFARSASTPRRNN